MSFKAWSLSSLALLAACSNASSSSDSSQSEVSIDYSLVSDFIKEGYEVVRTSDDLGECDESREGTATAVLADSSVHFCYDGKWNDKEQAGAYKEDGPLYECNAESEGDTVRTTLANVDGDIVYEDWFCKDGKWVSYYGADEVQGPRVYMGDYMEFENGTMVDARDNKTYKTLRFYTKMNPLNPKGFVEKEWVWMAENLNYKSDTSYCYDNRPENCDKYGRLYPWSDKLCPEGWHLPSMPEWQDLFNLAENKYIAAYHLKSKEGWKQYIVDYVKDGDWYSPVYAGPGDDKFGFAVLPGGYMQLMDSVTNMDEEALYVSNTSFKEWGYEKGYQDPSQYNFVLRSLDMSKKTKFWTSSSIDTRPRTNVDLKNREYVIFQYEKKEARFSGGFFEKNPKYIRCKKN